MIYPKVMDELATLAAVVEGRSIARYGDGEFNLCAGLSIPCQEWSRSLQHRLIGILKDPHETGCIVAIPNLHSETPKRLFWDKYHASARFLSGHVYASSFVTRPDSAPWINTKSYWLALESLWFNRDVTLVRGSARSLTAADLTSANAVTEIVAPKTNAWSGYRELLERVGTPQTALLCLGPTATVMAVDLCAKGVHAIDLGHAGMFLHKHRRGEPMVVTAQDKAS